MSDMEVTDATFHDVKYLTNAMLGVKVLKAIYNASLSVSEGIYVEIGPAQGGSTLAIALGRRSAGRDDMLYTADVFTNSAALKTADVKSNIAVLKGNLAEFGVGNNLRIIVVTDEDIETTIPADAKIGLFFVDADGALDRDFIQFYDRVLPGGHIIIDDCEDKIIEKYVDYPDAKLQRYVLSKYAKDVADLTPLGKHYTVYQFTQTLIKLGLVEEIETIANTAFLRKTGNGIYAESGALEAMAKTRAAIAQEFFDRRERAAQMAARA